MILWAYAWHGIGAAFPTFRMHQKAAVQGRCLSTGSSLTLGRGLAANEIAAGERSNFSDGGRNGTGQLAHRLNRPGNRCYSALGKAPSESSGSSPSKSFTDHPFHQHLFHIPSLHSQINPVSSSIPQSWSRAKSFSRRRVCVTVLCIQKTGCCNKSFQARAQRPALQVFGSNDKSSR